MTTHGTRWKHIVPRVTSLSSCDFNTLYHHFIHHSLSLLPLPFFPLFDIPLSKCHLPPTTHNQPNMSPPTPSVSIHLSTTTTTTPPLLPRITTNQTTLPSFSPTHPILRFSFPTVASQASHHRAFALLRTTKDKASFMAHYFDSYDGVISIPKVPARWDTSGDEEIAKRLWDEAMPPATHDDERLARLLYSDALPPPTLGDRELTRRLQEETPLPVTSRDEDIARMLQQNSLLPPATHTARDEALARRMQENTHRENGMERDFGRMTFADRRRRTEEQHGRRQLEQQKELRQPEQHGRRQP